MPLDENLIQDLLVKFACIITPIRTGKAAEREANEALNEVWPELFGEATGMSVQGTGPDGRPVHPVLIKAHKYYVGAGAALVPSLLLFSEGLEIHLRLRIGGQQVQEFSAYPWAADETLLNKVRMTIMKLSAAYRFNVRRTAQTFELQVFLPTLEQRLAVNEKILGSKCEDLAELQLTKAAVQKVEEKVYNYRTLIGYSLRDPAQGNTLMVAQFEANNREMSDSLDERKWQKIWKHGQAQRERMIGEVFPDLM